MKKTKSKKLFIALLSAAGVFAAVIIYMFVINAVIVGAGKERIAVADAASGFDADCILVLGAGLRRDGTPSDMLADRLDTAISLYFDGAAPCLLLSGDNSSKDYDEVSAMMKYAADRGVPEEALIPDYAGFSTYESLYRAREIFSAERVIIVTQEYHLYRALWCAEAFGVDAVGVSADLRPYRGQTFREVREVLARNKDFIFTIFKPEPTYLGEKEALYTEE